MRVDIEKRHIDSYKKIAIEANNPGKTLKKADTSKYKKSLFRKDITPENKKKSLVKDIHELIINTFPVNIKQIDSRALQKIKINIAIIRPILYKIKSINNFLEESFLRDLGIIKKSLVVEAIKSNKPAKYIESSAGTLSKQYISKIEHTIYELMHRIIFFDKKLLKKYKKREVRIIGKEKLGIKDLENTLKIESELLEVLEAKIPPSSLIKKKLFKKDIFNKWVPMVLALLSSLEAECEKEKLIFSGIKKNERLKNKIESKINHVVDEKEKLLKISEKRAMAMKSFKISDNHRQTFHEYVSAANL